MKKAITMIDKPKTKSDIRLLSGKNEVDIGVSSSACFNSSLFQRYEQFGYIKENESDIESGTEEHPKPDLDLSFDHSTEGEDDMFEQMLPVDDIFTSETYEQAEAIQSCPSKSDSSDAGNITEAFDIMNVPNMTKQQIKKALPSDWHYYEQEVKDKDTNETKCFVNIKDNADRIRIRIDSPHGKTTYSHVHLYDKDGNSLDMSGKIVGSKTCDAHIPYMSDKP